MDRHWKVLVHTGKRMELECDKERRVVKYPKKPFARQVFMMVRAGQSSTIKRWSCSKTQHCRCNSRERPVVADQSDTATPAQQRKMAEKLGLDPATLQGWKRGRIKRLQRT